MWCHIVLYMQKMNKDQALKYIWESKKDFVNISKGNEGRSIAL